jgi:hypothetical protein
VRAWWGRAHLPHLVRRLLASLRPGGPGPAEESWALAHLSDGEARLWRRLSGADRRHGIAVARRAGAALGGGRDVDRAVIAAALLHDAGKVESGLGTFGRVLATVAILGLGRERVETWAARRGPVGRAGRYARHPALGGLLLAGAGSEHLTVAWAAEHHLPAERWTLERDLAGVLKAADSV